MGKQVPLVIYKGGERIIIGMASVQDDGKIEAQIKRDIRDDIKKIISPGLGEISINPKPPVNTVRYDQPDTIKITGQLPQPLTDI